MKKTVHNLLNQKYILLFALLGIFLIIIGTLFNSYAYTAPVKNIRLTSKNLNYERGDPASFQVDKSTEWVSMNRARVTFNVESRVEKVEYAQNIVLVLDLSSVSEKNMNELRESTKSLLDYILSESNKQVALITFSDEATILSRFTKNKSDLVQLVDSLNRSSVGGTNHYGATLKIQELFSEYTSGGNSCTVDNECRVVMVSSGKPSIGKPNEGVEYENLKIKYPNLVFSIVQYDMGTEVIKEFKNMSDFQYIGKKGQLDKAMLIASGLCKVYSKFVVTDNLDLTYFSLDPQSIDPSIGTAKIGSDGSTLVWNLEDYRTSFDATLTIDLLLKDAYKSSQGYYPVGKSTKVEAILEDYQDSVTSTLTPVISTHYRVTYDLNKPDGCSVSWSVPQARDHKVFETVEKTVGYPRCGGYAIDSWDIATEGVEILNDDYFVMPEQDVVIRAVWSKLSIVKRMDGEVKETDLPIIQGVSYDYQEKLWQYKENVTKVVIQPSMKSVDNEVGVFDVSDANDNSVIARVTTNDANTSLYTVYIQGEGGVIANQNSNFLFADFSKLESIEGLEYFDTSNAKMMDGMFARCPALKSLDLSHFDTANVELMPSMFLSDSSLTSLNLSSFNTAKVRNMRQMFQGCSNLNTLNISSFDTGQVQDMSDMFYNCGSLTSLDLSHFNTSNVINIGEMFRDCSGLTSLNVSSFDTSKVTNMRGVFQSCSNLTSLDVSSFRTPNVTDMSYMFRICEKLTSIDVTKFDTSNVTQTFFMFDGCKSITSLDVSNFNTAKVENMLGMFSDCSQLTSLDLSNFNTSNVILMNGLFSGDQKLSSLNITSFDTSKVTNMSYMFLGTVSLPSLDLRNFNTANVEDMSYMFWASGISSLDVSSFNTSKVKTMEYMLGGMENMVTLDIHNFDTSNVTLMNSMFAYSSHLETVDLSHLDFSKVINTGFMFDGCVSLTTTININSTTIVTYQKMFNNCAKVLAVDPKITVNYTSAASGLVDQMIATKDDLSNVVKGSLIA